jgi:hypothetical protein
MFKKAERKKAKLRLAICGTSGSGKTFSALKIATGLGGKIAMLDTENGSGELYANDFDYDTASLTAPYSPDRYIRIINEAENAGYNVLIIDSLTHAWAGDGGLLDIKGKIDDRGGNSFTNWRTVTPQHNKLINAILKSNMHIICAMRSKTAYVIQENEKGKQIPVKIGLAPVQREGMDYEFTVVLDIAGDGHIATSSKDRTGLFSGRYFTPEVSDGKKLIEWLETGRDEEGEYHKLKAEIDGLEFDAEKIGEWAKNNIERLQALNDTLNENAREVYKAKLDKARLKAKETKNELV